MAEKSVDDDEFDDAILQNPLPFKIKPLIKDIANFVPAYDNKLYDAWKCLADYRSSTLAIELFDPPPPPPSSSPSSSNQKKDSRDSKQQQQQQSKQKQQFYSNQSDLYDDLDDTYLPNFIDFGLKNDGSDVPSKQKRVPTFSQTQHDIGSILEQKRQMRDRNLTAAAAEAAATSTAAKDNKTTTTATHTPSIEYLVSSALNPANTQPPILDVEILSTCSKNTLQCYYNKIQLFTNNDIFTFLQSILSISIDNLKSGNAEERITEHLIRRGLLRNANVSSSRYQQRQQPIPPLPLAYNTYVDYQCAYQPLIIYDTWAQITEAFHANTAKYFPLSITNHEGNTVSNMTTLWMKTLVPSAELVGERFSLENWLVVLSLNENENGNGNKTNKTGNVPEGPETGETIKVEEAIPAASSDGNVRIIKQKDGTEQKIIIPQFVIAFVSTIIKLEQYKSLAEAPAHYPRAKKTFKPNDTTETGAYSCLQFIVQFYGSPENCAFIAGQERVSMKSLYYIRPSLRYIESLSLMQMRPKFAETFLRPSLQCCTLDTKQPEDFVFFQKHRYNTHQRDAIVACYNAVCAPFAEQRVTLIQGPPGTGKTHTLVGIVKNLMINCVSSTSTSTSSKKPRPFRILICAPSNGAIDEIAIRLIRERKFLHQFKQHSLRIVRIGQRAQVRSEVKPYLLERLIEQNYQFIGRQRSKLELRDEILLNANVILSTLNSCQLTCMQMFRPETFGSYHKLFNALIVDEASQSTEPELLMPLIYPINKIILIGDHQQLPATVLSRVAFNADYGRSLFERFFRYFDSLNKNVDAAVVEAEEAAVVAAATAATTDPKKRKRLAIAAASAAASKKNPILTLCLQFRMHPQICVFPSQNFYNGLLKTADTAGVCPALSSLRPYTVFDITNSAEKRTIANTSTLNLIEIDFIFHLILHILNRLDYGPLNETSRGSLPSKLPFTIGVITFYRGQKEELAARLADFHGGLLCKHVDVNTVDAFQGQERDIIILSCVRAFDFNFFGNGGGNGNGNGNGDGGNRGLTNIVWPSSSSSFGGGSSGGGGGGGWYRSNINNSVGFVRSQQRMNVALTRAKCALYICMHSKSFHNVPHWHQLLVDAIARNRLVPVTSGRGGGDFSHVLANLGFVV